MGASGIRPCRYRNLNNSSRRLASQPLICSFKLLTDADYRYGLAYKSMTIAPYWQSLEQKKKKKRHDAPVPAGGC
jgi:hypothetical protein